MKHKDIIIISLIFILISLFAGCTNNSQTGEWGDAPDFSLKTLKGENIKLSDYKGNVLVLDFMWADCTPCFYQMPVLKAVSENYTNVEIISINVHPYETESYLQSFVDYFDNELGLKLDWNFGKDPDGSIAQNYVQDGGVPKVYVIDKNGNIYHMFGGYTEYSELSAKLDELI